MLLFTLFLDKDDSPFLSQWKIIDTKGLLAVLFTFALLAIKFNDGLHFNQFFWQWKPDAAASSLLLGVPVLQYRLMFIHHSLKEQFSSFILALSIFIYCIIWCNVQWVNSVVILIL